MTWDIRLIGHAAGGTTEQVDLLVSADDRLTASALMPRTAEATYDGSVRGYDALDPEDGFAHDQDSWHRGAGLDIQRRRGEDDYRYATANGVITWTQGSFSSGYYEEVVDTPSGVELADDALPNHEEINLWATEPVVFRHSVWIAFYKYLMKYENGVFTLEWTNPFNTLINSLAVYKDQLFIGMTPAVQNNRRYVYHLYDGTQYTPYFTNATDDYGINDPIVSKCAVVLNQDNRYSLAVVGPNGWLQTEDPTNIANWTNRISVGHSESIRFNSITPSNDTAYIGSSEGLFAYHNDTQDWRNIEPSIGLFEHTDRYSKVVHRNGGLYVARFDHNLWRIDDTDEITRFTELRSLINFPAWIGMSGNITAMAQDSNALYCMLSESPPETGGFPYRFPIKFGEAFQSVYTLIAVTDNDTSSHVLSRMSFVSVDKMIRYAADSRGATELLIFGTSHTLNEAGEWIAPIVPSVRKLVIPPDEDVPYRSNHRLLVSTPDGAATVRMPCNPDGWMTTQWFDFHWPDTPKTLVRVSLDAHWGGLPEDTGITPTVKVEYRTETNQGRDEDDNQWLPWGETRSVGFSRIDSDSAGPVIFNRIRFRIKLETDLRVPILVDSFVVHAMFGRPHRKRHQFLCNFVQSASDYRTTAEDANPMSKRKLLGRLVHEYPIMELVFNKHGHLDWLNDRGADEPRYVRIRRLEDDLQSKGRFDAKTAIEMLEVREPR